MNTGGSAKLQVTVDAASTGGRDRRSAGRWLQSGRSTVACCNRRSTCRGLQPSSLSATVAGTCTPPRDGHCHSLSTLRCCAQVQVKLSESSQLASPSGSLSQHTIHSTLGLAQSKAAWHQATGLQSAPRSARPGCPLLSPFHPTAPQSCCGAHKEVLGAAAQPGTQGAGCQERQARQTRPLRACHALQRPQGVPHMTVRGCTGPGSAFGLGPPHGCSKVKPSKPGLPGLPDHAYACCACAEGCWQGSGARGQGSEVGRRSMLRACRHAFAQHGHACTDATHPAALSTCTWVNAGSGRLLRCMRNAWHRPAAQAAQVACDACASCTSDQLHAPPPLLRSIRTGAPHERVLAAAAVHA